MEEVLKESQNTALNKTGSVVLDIESLMQASDNGSGSPKMTKALSRKGSSRMDRRNGEEHGQEEDEDSRKIVAKVPYSQTEQLKQQLLPCKSVIATPALVSITTLSDGADGRMRKLNRFTAINPKRILLLIASMQVLLEQLENISLFGLCTLDQTDTLNHDLLSLSELLDEF